jgi:hypothetical protein
LTYNLWQAWNDARESYEIEDPRSILKKTMVGMAQHPQTHVEGTGRKIQEHWLTLSQDLFKVNVDGAFRMPESKGGDGVVVRDCHGSFILGACHFSPT